MTKLSSKYKKNTIEICIINLKPQIFLAVTHLHGCVHTVAVIETEDPSASKHWSILMRLLSDKYLWKNEESTTSSPSYGLNSSVNLILVLGVNEPNRSVSLNSKQCGKQREITPLSLPKIPGNS